MAIEIVAEVGSNWYTPEPYDKTHQQILRCIDEAQQAGATAVKFQVFRADTLYSPLRAPKIHAMMKMYEFPVDLLPEVQHYAHDRELKLWASVFDVELVPQVARYVDCLKVASGDITHYPLITAAARACHNNKCQFCLSTGAATYAEVEEAINAAWAAGAGDMREDILMQCVSDYPASIEDYNLKAGLLFQEEVNKIGLSDHTQDTIVAQIALGMGYTVFEKHFKPDYAYRNPDYDVSLSAYQFGYYVKALRQAEKIIGKREKKPTESEMSERNNARRGSDGLRPIDSVIL